MRTMMTEIISKSESLKECVSDSAKCEEGGGAGRRRGPGGTHFDF